MNVGQILETHLGWACARSWASKIGDACSMTTYRRSGDMTSLCVMRSSISVIGDRDV
jgi:DNA-directed RNA polymerase beta subunit